MKVLLTNDDGIKAPGLKALEESIASVATATTVIAPHEHLSGCSHQVTTHQPIRLSAVATDRYAIDGTPADCVRVGVLHVASDVDWVLAGVNDGGNLGVDVHMSGTVAAVREATLLGIPAIAFSQYRRGKPGTDWMTTKQIVERVFSLLRPKPLPANSFWNVNLPDAAGLDAGAEIEFCPLDSNPLPVGYESKDGVFHYRGDYHSRRRSPGTDVDVCFAGRVAVTMVRINQDGPSGSNDEVTST